MRIAYLGQMADISTENGISKKIRAQIAYWSEVGHDVRYFSLVPHTRVWTGFTAVGTELIARHGPILRVAQSLRLARRIATWRPDAIYFRYAYHSAGLPALFREFPTVAEINSDDLTEYPATLSRAKVIYHRLTRRRVLEAVSALMPVTHELAERFAHFDKPTCVLGNGIRLDEFAPLPPPVAEAEPRWIFIGSAGAPWHGLDRVVELARMFPDIGIDVVGDKSIDRAPPNLRLHGTLSRSGYEPLLSAATVALGTLGLYRKKMHEACPLKVREYLALGLPVIAGYCDTDIPAEADYFCRLPNDAQPLAPLRPQIVEFVETWRRRRVARSVVAHLDCSVKEKQRLDFITQVVANAQPTR